MEKRVNRWMDIVADRFGDRDVRPNVFKLLGKFAEQGLMEKEAVTKERVMMLMEMAVDKDENIAVSTGSAELLAKFMEKGWVGAELVGEIIPALVKALGDMVFDVRSAAAQALGAAIEKGGLQILSAREVSDYYFMLQNERKSKEKILSDDGLDSRRALLLKANSIMEGKVDAGDVKHIEQIADVTEDRNSLRATLEIARVWASEHGSNDAQNFLERKVGQIVSRNPRDGQGYVETTESDELYIEAVADSFKQGSLLPIFIGRKFNLGVRLKIMKSLAKSGYIDYSYARIREEDVERYLELISEVYDEFKLVAPKILIGNLMNNETTINSLKGIRPRLDKIIAKRDYRVLIQELSRDEEMLFAYYMLNQSPFQYQGTDPISYERFKKLVKDSAKSLGNEETAMVEGRLKDGFVRAGLDEERAKQIAQSILKGQPPLPRDSPYLDENGDFIPQKVDVISTLGDSDVSREAKASFDSSMNNIVLVLKINDLMSRIPKGIEKRFSDDAKGKADMAKQYEWVVDGISSGISLPKLLTELKELNDLIFPPHGRKRDLDVMVAAAVNKQIRNTPMHQDIISTISTKKKEAAAEQKRIYLEDIDINGVVRNLDKMVNDLQAKQQSNKLTSIERQIIKEDEITGKHVISVFFANLFQRAQLGKKNPLYPILQDMEAHLSDAFDNYVQAVSAQVDIREVPQVVYVDFISKFNLMEFFRFADGAHCCLSSDPSVNSQYGSDIFSRQMPRYLTNATSFWWQFTADARNGKQIGWFENWFGLDEGEGDKVFVGTELTYLSSGHHDRDLQTALLAQVERILFSTKVTKIAQANFGHHAARAMSPPSNYTPEKMKLTKLQSLRDREPIYEDAPLAANKSVAKDIEVIGESTKGFFVKNNPGDVVVEAAVEADRYNVSMEFLEPSQVTEALVSRLLEIEAEAFRGHTSEGAEFMRRRITNSKILMAIFKDEDTGEIVGYRYAIPASEEKQLRARDERHRRSDVLYLVHVALLPKYWGKADIGSKYREVFQRAKELGYKYLTTHAVSGHGAATKTTWSEKFQAMGFEYKYTESRETGWDEKYDFLVLDLSKVDRAMLVDGETALLQQNPGGIDFNLDLLELEIQGRGSGFSLPDTNGNFDHIHIDEGLLPVIMNITPINSPLPLLGLERTEEEEYALSNLN